MSLGQALRQLRKQKGLTLEELARRTNSHVGNLSRIERNVSRPSLELLYRISEALDFRMSEVFALSEPGNKEANPDQIALNAIFISLLEKDRGLLLDFAHLLQKRVSLTADQTNTSAHKLPTLPYNNSLPDKEKG
ncbi:helix-turn-helix domain-containing protein [Vreelandella venusta]|uniref:helix-turn-helix domain-containing protein n=1 Tax=Vreelandella venusta TaxID=44935 RepID=UPI00384E2026